MFEARNGCMSVLGQDGNGTRIVGTAVKLQAENGCFILAQQGIRTPWLNLFGDAPLSGDKLTEALESLYEGWGIKDPMEVFQDDLTEEIVW